MTTIAGGTLKETIELKLKTNLYTFNNIFIVSEYYYEILAI